MIIVSQDRRMIINFENIVGVLIRKNVKEDIYQIQCKSENEKNARIIAKYKTEERAKEILNEIVKTYSSYMQLNGGPAIIQGQSDIAPAIFNIPKVYKIPEE